MCECQLVTATKTELCFQKWKKIIPDSFLQAQYMNNINTMAPSKNASFSSSFKFYNYNE